MAPPPPRIRPWWFLGALLALVGLLVAASLAAPGFYESFTEPYLWGPVIRDEGFNPVNTLVLGLFIALLIGWTHQTLRRFGQTVDAKLVVAVLPFLLLGPVLRVLEDSDFFAPFAEGGTVPPNAACVPGLTTSVMQACFGVLFVTPLNFVWLLVLLVAFGRIGERAWKIGEHMGLRAGLKFHGLVLVAGLALYGAWWASDPSYVRFVPSPALVALALGPAYWVVHRAARRDGVVNWRWCLFAYGFVLLAAATHPVLAWLAGGRGEWRPANGTQAWVLVGFAAVCAGMGWLAWRGASHFAKGRGRRASSPVGPLASYAYVLVVGGYASFVALVGLGGLARGDAPVGVFLILVGALVVLGGDFVLRRAASGRVGRHVALEPFLGATGLLVIVGQAADGLMTSLGIDVFGAEEKHVVPRSLIAFVDGLDLPDPLQHYPGALVMVPYKLLLAIGFLALVDVWNRAWFASRQNLRELLKIAVLAVGLVPGLRDALRLSMGV